MDSNSVQYQLKAIVKRKDTWVYVFLLPLVVLTCLILFREFVFGGKALIFLDIGNDTYYAYYRAYYFITESLRSLDFPAWSFQMGAGTNVLTLYAYLFDPFSLIYYVVGEDHLSGSVVYVFILKAVMSAWFMYLYLRYIKLVVPAAIVGAFIFAFNGHSMLWGQHYYFGSIAVFLPLLLLSLERWMVEGKWGMLLLTFSVMSLNLYNFYPIAIFLTFYFLFRFYIKNGLNVKLFVISSARLAVIYIVALLLASPLLLPEYYVLHTSPRVSGGILSVFNSPLVLASAEYYYSLFFRLFSNNLQGTGSAYIGYKDYYAPLQLYISTLSLVLIPQLYFLLDRRLKLTVTIMLFITILFMVLPFFAQVMNGFQYPSYRWGLVIVVPELILLAYILNLIYIGKKINVKALVITCATLVSSLVIVVVTYAAYFENVKVDYVRIVVITVFVLVYAKIVYEVSQRGSAKGYMFPVLIMLLVVDVLYEHDNSFNKRSTLVAGIESKRNVDLFASTIDAMKYLKSIDNSFYRVDKNRWILSLNDSLVQGYYGLDTYDSLNTPSYYDFIYAMDLKLDDRAITIPRLGWTSLQRPLMSDLMSAKYYLTKDIETHPEHVKYLTTIGDIYVFERTNYLPFGFTYDSYINRDLFEATVNIEDRDVLLFRGFLPSKITGDDVFDELQEINTVETGSPEKFRAQLIEDVLVITLFSEDYIRGNISVNSDKMLFLSIPYDSGWHAKVNGVDAIIHKVNIGFTGLMLSEGESTIELEYRLPYLRIGLLLFSVGVILIAAYLSIGFRLKFERVAI